MVVMGMAGTGMAGMTRRERTDMASQRSAKVFVTESGQKIHGLLAEFATPADLYHACEKVRDAGYSQWDSHSPFPLHGMEEAMGIKRTKLPLIVAAGGFTGASLGYLMQYWMSGVDYLIMKQGKPFAAWQAHVPITFELGILLSAFSAIIGMLALNGLPRWHHPLFRSTRFLRATQDRFFISIEAGDGKFDPDATQALLAGAGATNVEFVEE